MGQPVLASNQDILDAMNCGQKNELNASLKTLTLKISLLRLTIQKKKTFRFPVILEVLYHFQTQIRLYCNLCSLCRLSGIFLRTKLIKHTGSIVLFTGMARSKVMTIPRSKCRHPCFVTISAPTRYIDNSRPGEASSIVCILV